MVQCIADNSNTWRYVWNEYAKKPYNILNAVRSFDASNQSGFLKSYGILSGIIHGTICKSGDVRNFIGGGLPDI